jgi:uncharacterized protein (DUF1330 family)
VLTHIAFLKLDDPDAIDEVVRRARALAAIEGVVDLEAGRDVLHVAVSWDVALVIHFADREAQVHYLADPRHVDFVTHVQSIGRTSAVVAFER